MNIYKNMYLYKFIKTITDNRIFNLNIKYFRVNNSLSTLQFTVFC